MRKQPEQKDRYTVNRILRIINDYHRNMQLLAERDADGQLMRSFGIAQYGTDMVMPRADGVSSIVENFSIGRIDASRYWVGVLTDMKYIQDRFYRIEDESQAIALSLRLDGHTTAEISKIMGRHKDHVNKLIRLVAVNIKGGYLSTV